MDKFLMCTNVQCSTYVYGVSVDACPECGTEGKPMTVRQGAQFLDVYHGRTEPEEIVYDAAWAKEQFAKYLVRPCPACDADKDELCKNGGVWVHLERILSHS